MSLAAGDGGEGRAERRRTSYKTAFPDLDFEHIGGVQGGASGPGRTSSIHTTDAAFSLRSSGLGTLLHVRVEPGATVTASPGRVIGHSPAAETGLVLTTAEQGVVAAAGRVLSGAPTVLSKIAAPVDAPVDALVAPHDLSDVALLELDGAARYCLAPGAVLAATEGIRLGPWTGLSRAGHARLAHATGRGLLALTAYGGIASLKLERGESYVVRASHLVAWDDRVKASRFLSQSRAEKEDAEGGENSVASGARLGALASRIGSALKSFLVFGANLPFVRLEGPGEVLVKTRTPPRFRLLESFKSSPPPPTAQSLPQAAPAAEEVKVEGKSKSKNIEKGDAPKSRFGGVFAGNAGTTTDEGGSSDDHKPHKPKQQ